MLNKTIVMTIENFDQRKLIENDITVEQAVILRAINVLININTAKDGSEYHKTALLDGELFYDIPLWDIIDSIPILKKKIKTKRGFMNHINPLIKKGFIIKYEIKTKYLIRLNNLDKLRNDKK